MRLKAWAIIATGFISLASCSSSNDESKPLPPTGTSSASASTEVTAEGPTEDALRERLRELYEFARRGDFAGSYDYLSPRCQAEISQDAYVDAIERDSEGRDYSGDPEYLINIDGSVATVVTKGADGKSALKPKTWTYADGQWQFDNC